ncbi:Glycoside hydrolase family 132 protein [Trichoderma simmonsii]|uniref:Glycoside hydrolase family 132 protein n=1 Tax=Trichoderma simmonsii TaxID=1491479 RepID=A0A8G0L5I6_9HYPO|nr:Glycoside hydrolase family 132 protein [Trichoderma simmonsii]
MKVTDVQAALASAVVLLSLPAGTVASSHRRFHQLPNKKHTHLRSPHTVEDANSIVKRGQCAFPTDDPNLVAVTPDAENAGWAMSPDQPCTPGHYCPIACKPGMVMAQWDPDSSYSYPASMNGGLFCDNSGTVHKPFPNKPYCVEGTGSVVAVNDCGEPMSWCQTVLPGNEAMLIPTLVTSSATLAVPDTSYWCSTAAHYYINPPGSTVADCVWGVSSKPVGNWSPYVAGANTDGNGNTFVKLGWNPIWQDSALKSTLPTFGIKIECPNGGCNGLPCEISPNSDGSVESNESSVGAGNAAFCVVTVPKGGVANIVAFNVDGSSGGSGGDDSDSGSSSSSSAQPSSTPHGLKAGGFAQQAEKATSTTTTAQPSSTEVSTTATPSSTEATSTTAAASSTTTAAESTTQTTDAISTTEATSATSTTGGKASSTASQARAHASVKPGMFHENGTSSHQTTSAPAEPSQTQAVSAPVTTTTKKGEAGRQQGSTAFAGLIVAFVAAACFL